MSDNVLIGGMPTAPDVTRLMETFPVSEMAEGDVIKHSAIASALRISKSSTRYRSVVSAWRKKLRIEHNIDVAAETGIGYRVLSDSERVSHGLRDYRSSTRKLVRAADRIARANPEKLSEPEARKREHANKLLASQISIARSTVHEIGSAGRVTTNPRPKLSAV